MPTVVAYENLKSLRASWSEPKVRDAMMYAVSNHVVCPLPAYAAPTHRAGDFLITGLNCVRGRPEFGQENRCVGDAGRRVLYDAPPKHLLELADPILPRNGFHKSQLWSVIVPMGQACLPREH